MDSVVCIHNFDAGIVKETNGGVVLECTHCITNDAKEAEKVCMSLKNDVQVWKSAKYRHSHMGSGA
jgi:hypothetical protein